MPVASQEQMVQVRGVGGNVGGFTGPNGVLLCCPSCPTGDAYNGGRVDGADNGCCQTAAQVLECTSVTQHFLDNCRPLVD